MTLRTSTDVDLSSTTLQWWTHGRRQPCVQESPSTWTCGADETGPFHVLAEARCLEPGRLNLVIASDCGHAVTQDVTLDLSELDCDEDAASVIVTIVDAAGRPATPREVA